MLYWVDFQIKLLIFIQYPLFFNTSLDFDLNLLLHFISVNKLTSIIWSSFVLISSKWRNLWNLIFFLFRFQHLRNLTRRHQILLSEVFPNNALRLIVFLSKWYFTYYLIFVRYVRIFGFATFIFLILIWATLYTFIYRILFYCVFFNVCCFFCKRGRGFRSSWFIVTKYAIDFEAYRIYVIQPLIYMFSIQGRLRLTLKHIFAIYWRKFLFLLLGILIIFFLSLFKWLRFTILERKILILSFNATDRNIYILKPGILLWNIVVIPFFGGTIIGELLVTFGCLKR